MLKIFQIRGRGVSDTNGINQGNYQRLMLQNQKLIWCGCHAKICNQSSKRVSLPLNASNASLASVTSIKQHLHQTTYNTSSLTKHPNPASLHQIKQSSNPETTHISQSRAKTNSVKNVRIYSPHQRTVSRAVYASDCQNLGKGYTVEGGRGYYRCWW